LQNGHGGAGELLEPLDGCFNWQKQSVQMLCLQQFALFNESNSKKQIGHSSDCFESGQPDDLGASFFSLMSLTMFASLKSVTVGLSLLLLLRMELPINQSEFS